MTPNHQAILGVGNVLMGDDGLGVHAIWALQKQAVPSGTELIDGGTQGLALMEIVRGLKRLVVVDCIRAGQAPGTLYRFELADLPSGKPRGGPTLHQAGVRDLLDLLILVDEVPRTTFVGMEPLRLEMGEGLSEPVEAMLPSLVDLCLKLVSET